MSVFRRRSRHRCPVSFSFSFPFPFTVTVTLTVTANRFPLYVTEGLAQDRVGRRSLQHPEGLRRHHPREPRWGIRLYPLHGSGRPAAAGTYLPSHRLTPCCFLLQVCSSRLCFGVRSEHVFFFFSFFSLGEVRCGEVRRWESGNRVAFGVVT